MDSFIAWVGGKKLLRKAICDQFPDKFGKYIEVFGGAGWVLFHKDKHAAFEVYNDINGELVNLFRCVKHHPTAVAENLQYQLNSREIFGWLKSQPLSHLTDIQRASRFLYLIRTSYGAKTTTYGAKPRGFCTLDELAKVAERLSRVVIEHMSFDSLIPRYDSSDTLFYCDPPYVSTERYYDTGDYVFGKEQHLQLFELLCSIKGKFVLSYNDCEFVRGLYRGLNIVEVERQNNLAGRYGVDRRYRELIIKNF